MADDEFAMRRAMERAAVAQQFLESEIVKEIFDTLEAIYLKAWKASEPRDVAGREMVHQRLQALDKLKSDLELVAAHGRMASQQIERDFRPPKRFGIV
jgi:hypothetical protein